MSSAILELKVVWCSQFEILEISGFHLMESDIFKYNIELLPSGGNLPVRTGWDGRRVFLTIRKHPLPFGISISVLLNATLQGKT